MRAGAGEGVGVAVEAEVCDGAEAGGGIGAIGYTRSLEAPEAGGGGVDEEPDGASRTQVAGLIAVGIVAIEAVYAARTAAETMARCREAKGTRGTVHEAVDVIADHIWRASDPVMAAEAGEQPFSPDRGMRVVTAGAGVS